VALDVPSLKENFGIDAPKKQEPPKHDPDGKYIGSEPFRLLEVLYGWLQHEKVDTHTVAEALKTLNCPSRVPVALIHSAVRAASKLQGHPEYEAIRAGEVPEKVKSLAAFLTEITDIPDLDHRLSVLEAREIVDHNVTLANAIIGQLQSYTDQLLTKNENFAKLMGAFTSILKAMGGSSYADITMLLTSSKVYRGNKNGVNPWIYAHKLVEGTDAEKWTDDFDAFTRDERAYSTNDLQEILAALERYRKDYASLSTTFDEATKSILADIDGVLAKGKSLEEKFKDCVAQYLGTPVHGDANPVERFNKLRNTIADLRESSLKIKPNVEEAKKPADKSVKWSYNHPLSNLLNEIEELKQTHGYYDEATWASHRTAYRTKLVEAMNKVYEGLDHQLVVFLAGV